VFEFATVFLTLPIVLVNVKFTEAIRKVRPPIHRYSLKCHVRRSIMYTPLVPNSRESEKRNRRWNIIYDLK